MTTPEPRPLLERLTEYRDSMGFMAPQLQDIIDRLPRGADPTPLQDGIKFYTQVTIDLTNLVNGIELKAFTITGELPHE